MTVPGMVMMAVMLADLAGSFAHRTRSICRGSADRRFGSLGRCILREGGAAQGKRSNKQQ